MINWDDEAPDQPKTVAANPVTPATGQPAASPLSQPALPNMPGVETAPPAPDIWANLGNLISGAFEGKPGEQKVQAAGFGILKNIGDAASSGPAKYLPGNPIGPYESVAAGLSHMPLNDLPMEGDANDIFQQTGDWIRANDPGSLESWLTTKAAAEADPLAGGNLKAEYNMEAAKRYDKWHKESVIGYNPEIYMGRGAIGSVGGALGNAIKGILSLPSQWSNQAAAATGFLDQGTARLQGLVNTYNEDPNLLTNPVEREVAGLLSDGKIDEVHAVHILMREGAGYSGDPMVNLTATMLLDPTTWTPIVAGKIAKLAEAGALIERGIEAGTTAQKGISAATKAADAAEAAAAAAKGTAAEEVSAWTASAARHGARETIFNRGNILPERLRPFEKQMDQVKLFVADQRKPFSEGGAGEFWRLARATLGADPLGAFTPSSQAADAESIMDIEASHMTYVYRRAYNPIMVTRAQQRARGYGIGPEVDQILADSANYQWSQHVSREATASAILEEARISGTPDEYIELANQMQAKSQLDRGVEFVEGQKFVPHLPGQLDDLAFRISKVANISKEQAAADIAKMSRDERAVWWDVTFGSAYREMEIAKQGIIKAGLPKDFPMDRVVLMNENTLTDVEKETLLTDIREFLKKDDLATANLLWDAAVAKHPQLGFLGAAKGGKVQLEEMLDHVERFVVTNRTATPDEEAVLGPIMEMLGRHENNGKPLYRIGFKPPQEDAWGMGEDAITGRLTVPRQPDVARQIGTALPRPRYYDVARNSLGQIIGRRAADRLTRPVESMSALFEAQKDIISGHRLVLNWKTAFIRNMEQKGVTKGVAEDIFAAITLKTQARQTTIRAARPEDMGAVLRDLAAGGMKAEDGTTTFLRATDGTLLTEHDLLDLLLDATKGDFRIVGFGTGLTQRMRNMVRDIGLDKQNNLGEFTITQYLNFRYRLNPTFSAQRALEGPYYAVYYGVRPVGRTLPEHLKETEIFMRNLGNTTVGRDFALDSAEYAVRSNFGLMITEEMARLSGVNKAHFRNLVERYVATADPFVRNNMIAMAHGRLGSMVRGLLDNVEAMVERNPGIEGIAREMGVLGRSFEDMGVEYSKAAGRTLTDDEVGLKYLQELFTSSRRMRATENGIDVRGLVSEQAWMSPTRLGEIGTLHPDNIAIDLGFQDLKDLRRQVTSRIDPSTGRHINTLDMPGLAAKMRAANYHEDVIRRLTGLNAKGEMVNPHAYFASTWDEFFRDFARPFGEGGMDISPHAAAGLKDLIRGMAKKAEMEPWEYLSAVIGHNVGGKDLKTVMGDLARFLQGNAKAQPLRAWIKHFNSVALQESGARALVAEYEKVLPGLIKEAQAANDATKMAELNKIAGYLKGGTEESGGAVKAATAPAKALKMETPQMGQGFDEWRKPLWDRLKDKGTPVPPTDGLFRAMSDAEFEAAQKTGEFKPLLGKDLYVTNDADRLAGGAYGGKSGGYIVEFDPSVPTHTTGSRTVDLEEIAVENAPQSAVRRVWKYDPAKGDHVLIQDNTATASAVWTPKVGTTENVPVEQLDRYMEIDRAKVSKAGDLFTGDLPDSKELWYRSHPTKRPKTGPYSLAEGETPGINPAVESLAADIKANGIKKPLILEYDAKTGTALLTDGNHRLAAAKMAGITEVPVEVRPVKFLPSEIDPVTGETVAPQGFVKVPGTEVASEADKMAFKDVVGDAYEEWFEKEIVRRIKSGKPHQNPQIEAISRGLSDWTKQALTKTQAGQTRNILKELVEKVPGEHGTYWNHSEALVHQVARSKIRDIERDVFRLAEMQTERTSFGRSLNHPVFGFYPASYMWGKVFPETVKFLTKSPYGITYDILKVQALIAAERDANPDFESQMHNLDRSAGAFLLGYLTPSLPWESQTARMSFLFRDMMEGLESGKYSQIPGAIMRDALKMIDPSRGYRDTAESVQEVGKFVGDTISPDTQQQLQSLPAPLPPGVETPPPGAQKGPVKGTELEPILADSMQELLEALK